MNPAHLHIILNHIPVIGIPISALLLIYGLLRKSDEVIKVSLLAFFIIGLLTIPTFLSGNAAEDVVEHLPGVTEELIESHEEAALIGFIASLILGGLSIAGLLFSKRVSRLTKPLNLVLLVLSLIVSGWLAWTANLGGKIRHTEVRANSAVATEEEGTEEGEREGEGRGRGRNRGGRDN